MDTRVSLQEPDSALVGIGGVVVTAHTFFKSESLVDTGEHVGVVALRVVVNYKSTFPKRAYGFDALELIGFFAAVGQNGELISADISLAPELVENSVLHEVGLHIPPHGNSLLPGPDKKVVAPSDQFGDRALTDKSAEMIERGTGLSPEFCSLKVVFV